MRSRLIGHEIDMGRIQPPPPPPPPPLPTHTHTEETLLTLISMKPNVLHLNKCYPLTSVM